MLANEYADIRTHLIRPLYASKDDVADVPVSFCWPKRVEAPRAVHRGENFPGASSYVVFRAVRVDPRVLGRAELVTSRV